MKILITTILLLFFYFISPAQVYVGHGGSKKKNKITIEELQKLENTTTVFVYGKKDIPEFENWKKVFDEIWKITPVIFVRNDKILPYLKNQAYSFLTISNIRRYTTIYDHSPTSTQSSNLYFNPALRHSTIDSTLSSFYLDLWMCKDLPGDSSSLYDLKKRTLFARIDLSGSDISMNKLWDINPDEKFDRFYKDFKYYNWLPGMLKQDLKMINDSISINKPWVINGEHFNKTELKKLKTEKLFISSDVLTAGGYLPFARSDFIKYDTADIMRFYPYSYQLLSDKELSDKVITNESFYYMIFIRNALSSSVNVFESPSGRLIYSRIKTELKNNNLYSPNYTGPYTYFYSKYFKELTSAIDKN